MVSNPVNHGVQKKSGICKPKVITTTLKLLYLLVTDMCLTSILFLLGVIDTTIQMKMTTNMILRKIVIIILVIIGNIIIIGIQTTTILPIAQERIEMKIRTQTTLIMIASDAQKDILTRIQMMIIKMKDLNHKNIRLGGETIIRIIMKDVDIIGVIQIEPQEMMIIRKDYTRKKFPLEGKAGIVHIPGLRKVFKTLIITRIVIIISVNITILLKNKYIKTKIWL